MRKKRRLDQVRASEFVETGLFKRASKQMKALAAASHRYPDVGRATPRKRSRKGTSWSGLGHASFDNHALARMSRDDLTSAAPIERFLNWMANKPPDFHAHPVEAVGPGNCLRRGTQLAPQKDEPSVRCRPLAGLRRCVLWIRSGERPNCNARVWIANRPTVHPVLSASGSCRRHPL